MVVEQKQGTGLLIGWKGAEVPPQVGFNARDALNQYPESAVTYDSEGHIMTIAPTGAGKGVGCVVPAILRHDGPIVVMDVKAENYAMTRRYRASIGSKISCIDPFGVAQSIIESEPLACKEEIVGFNPFDLLPYLSDDRDTACRSLAQMLVAPDGHSSDPFWQQAAVGVIAALIRCYDQYDGPMRSISAIVNDLGIEVTEATTPGHISVRANAMSYLTSDLDLLDEIEGAGLSIESICSAFDAVHGRGSKKTRRTDVIDIAADAALAAINYKNKFNNEQKSDEEIASEMANIIVEQERYHHFSARVFMAALNPEVSEELVQRIWDTLNLSRESTSGRPVHGSFAYDFRTQDMPENYPLAMHRLSRDPNQMCRSVAAQPIASDKTWGSIFLIVRSELAQFSGRSIARTLSGSSSIDLDAIRKGDDASIYIVFPPARIRSHATLFRVIVEGILSVIVSRNERPPKRTLLLLDEIAQLGRLDLLVTAKTLLRGYGVQVWSFWQDISQIKANYPRDWQTIMNNCRIVQVFGRGLGVMGAELAQALDVSPSMILDLKSDDLLAWVEGQSPQVLRRPVCYSDASLRDLCDDGPFALPALTRKDASEE